MELPRVHQQKGELGNYLPHRGLHNIFRNKLGEATNNFSEFMAINLLILLAKEKGISQLTIYGDSLLVVNCMNALTLFTTTQYDLCWMVSKEHFLSSHISLLHMSR
jgi:ribonuclease HI